MMRYKNAECTKSHSRPIRLRAFGKGKAKRIVWTCGRDVATSLKAGSAIEKTRIDEVLASHPFSFKLI
jgi:hypothetical protein